MSVDVRGDAEVFYLDPTEPIPPNRIQNWTQYNRILASMKRDGWCGPPLVVMSRDHYDPPCPPIAITGSHRLRAADLADIEVPCVELADLYQRYGMNLDDLLDEWLPEGEVHSQEAILRTVARLLHR